MKSFYRYCTEVFFAIKPFISAWKYLFLPGSAVAIVLATFREQILKWCPDAADYIPPPEVFLYIGILVFVGIAFWGGFSLWSRLKEKLTGVDCKIDVKPVKREPVYVSPLERKIVIQIDLTVKNLTEADVVISEVVVEHSLNSLKAGGGGVRLRHIASNGFGKDIVALPKTLKPNAIEVFYFNFECNISGCNVEDLSQKIADFWACESLGCVAVHKKDLTDQTRVSLEAKKVIDEFPIIS